jgi:hypothetical protein
MLQNYLQVYYLTLSFVEDNLQYSYRTVLAVRFPFKSADEALNISEDPLLYTGGCSSVPPPPPPPPTGRARSPPAPKAMDFPQLDLVDLSFDLGQLPDLPTWGQEAGGQDSRLMEVQPACPPLQVQVSQVHSHPMYPT